jgi:isoleucyl-tRNA synthetase
VRLSYVLAPFTPFLADELYQKLTGGESVHLQDWLPAGHVNEIELERMAFAREVINDGLRQRAAAGIKVRQPLKEIRFEHAPAIFEKVDFEYEYMIMQELNVKAVSYNTAAGDLVITLDTEITPELKREGLMREVVRHVQSARKAAGLNVDDHIDLVLSTEDKELKAAIDEHAETIKSETLADTVTNEGKKTYQSTAKIEGRGLTVGLEKA